MGNCFGKAPTTSINERRVEYVQYSIKHVDENETVQSINRQDSVKEFTLSCDAVSNGILDLNITDFQDLRQSVTGSAELNSYYQKYHNHLFEFIYRYKQSVSLRNGNIEDTNWKIKQFIARRIVQNGRLYVRVPVLLNDYNIEFYIKIDHKDNKIYQSEPQIVNVPSFLIHSNFKVGDVILFKPNDAWYTGKATIMEILEDNYYKIRYYQHDPIKGAKSDPSSWIKIITTIHFSRIFSDRKQLQQMIDLNDDRMIKRNLLIQSNDNQCIDTFNAIYDGLTDIMDEICKTMYNELKYLANCKALHQFMVKNVFDMLFDGCFDHNVGCFVDGNDGFLDFVNLKQYDTKISCMMLKDGENDTCPPDMINDIIYSCDWCSVELRDWDLIFSCKAHYVDQHYYCLKCVNTVITLNKELKDLLTNILDNQLIDDCVQSIVDYVVGKVVSTSPTQI